MHAWCITKLFLPLRFDHVYVARFLLNRTTIHDSYPALQASFDVRQRISLLS